MNPQEEKLVKALRKIEQMSDPGNYEKAIIEMKSIATQAIADYHKSQKEDLEPEALRSSVGNPIELRNEIAVKEGAPYHETSHAREVAFKNGWDEGFVFRNWLAVTSMSHPDIPIHIKYRMFKNQEARKIENEIKGSQTNSIDKK